MKTDANVNVAAGDFSITKRLEHARAKLESSRNQSVVRKIEQLLKMAMGRDEDSEDCRGDEVKERYTEYYGGSVVTYYGESEENNMENAMNTTM